MTDNLTRNSTGFKGDPFEVGQPVEYRSGAPGRCVERGIVAPSYSPDQIAVEFGKERFRYFARDTAHQYLTNPNRPPPSKPRLTKAHETGADKGSHDAKGTSDGKSKEAPKTAKRGGGGYSNGGGGGGGVSGHRGNGDLGDA